MAADADNEVNMIKKKQESIKDAERKGQRNNQKRLKKKNKNKKYNEREGKKIKQKC